MMLAQAITNAKSTEPKALQAAFNSISHFGGITGDLGFSPQNHVTITAAELTLVKYDAATKTWVEVTD